MTETETQRLQPGEIAAGIAKTTQERLGSLAVVSGLAAAKCKWARQQKQR
jgi:hypothetical protein